MATYKPRPKQYVAIEKASAIRDTGKALIVLIEEEEYVIPKSQIHDDSEVYEKGHEGKLIIPKWLAENEELEGEDYEGT